MRRRLDLAMTLMGARGSSSSTSRRPASTRAAAATMWHIVRELVADGVTILLTTQYLEEADQLADRIARPRRRPDRRRRHPRGTQAAGPRRPHPAPVRRRRAARVRRPRAPRRDRGDDDALTLEVPSDGSVGALRTVLAGSTTPRIEVAELTVHTPDLDDVFLALTGRADAQRGAADVR